MYPLPAPFILPFKLMFYNILINQPFTKLFQKSFEKKTDMFGVNRYIGYFAPANQETVSLEIDILTETA